MPELPETETIVRQIKRIFSGKFLKYIRFEDEDKIVISSIIENVDRVGKKVVFKLTGQYLIISLGMTGRLLLDKYSNSSPYTRARLVFEDEILLFDDMRRFGEITTSSEPPQTGIDPLLNSIDVDELLQLFHSNKPVKQLLLDQGLICGIGNIYACEILCDSRIHPQMRGCELNEESATKLITSTKKTLQLAISNCGTTIRDFTDLHNREGEHQHHLNVYGRSTCGLCGGEVETVKIYGRNTYYCVDCQPALGGY